jgi:ParB family chromosome partitioning protein
LTQDQLAQKISKSRSSITNHLRLLKLPAEIQLGVRDTLISMGHARALVSAGEEEKQLELYRQIVDHQLSVREVEEMIKSGTKRSVEPASTPSSTKETEVSLTPAQDVFRLHLSDKISSKVSIKKNADGNGKISISFSSEVDLNRIIEILNK